MKISYYLTAFLASTVLAAPVAIAEANPLALADAAAVAEPEPAPLAKAAPLSFPDADARAEALAVALANADPEAVAAAIAAPLSIDIGAADQGFNELTTYLGTLRSLLVGGNLPILNLGSLLTLLSGLFNALLDILGESTGLTSMTDVLKKFLADAVPALGTVAQQDGTDAALDEPLHALLVQYAMVLVAVIDMTTDLIPNLQSMSVIGSGLALVRGLRNVYSAFEEANGS